MQLIITTGEGFLGRRHALGGSLFTGLSYQQRLPRCLKYCFPHSAHWLCRVPLPALWSGSLSRQRASPVVAWTSFPPSLGITSLPCLMSPVSKTTALCVLRVWFWLLWVGGKRENRSLSVSLGRKWEQSLCFAALCGVSSAFSEVPGKRLQKIKGDSGVRGWRVASWLAFYRT